MALLNPEVSGRLCLTLLHSLWQVPLLVIVVWMRELVLRPSVQCRYAIHTAAMIGGLLALPVTLALVDFGAVNAADTLAASNQLAHVEPVGNLIEAKVPGGVGAGAVVGQHDVSTGTWPATSLPRRPPEGIRMPDRATGDQRTQGIAIWLVRVAENLRPPGAQRLGSFSAVLRE